jgi:hypothetical protein
VDVRWNECQQGRGDGGGEGGGAIQNRERDWMTETLPALCQPQDCLARICAAAGECTETHCPLPRSPRPTHVLGADVAPRREQGLHSLRVAALGRDEEGSLALRAGQEAKNAGGVEI